jgi:hypothetical protein
MRSHGVGNVGSGVADGTDQAKVDSAGLDEGGQVLALHTIAAGGGDKDREHVVPLFLAVPALADRRVDTLRLYPFIDGVNVVAH